jgi:NADH dehydrogenase (ubiquinone) 1 alpha subcomplex subunit 5
MRATSRLLVTAKYLTPGAPTGLTGVFTHSAPRTTLLYLYNSTLDKLKKFPDHSVYRQSVEALTKHRLSIVESVKPAGLEEWQTRVRPIVDAHPQAFRTVPSAADPSFVNIVFKRGAVKDIDTEAYGDELLMKPQPEGPRVRAEKKHQAAALMRNFAAENAKIPQIEPEPRLTADQ